MHRKVWFGKDIFSFGSVQNVLIFIEVASLHLRNDIIGHSCQTMFNHGPFSIPCYLYKYSLSCISFKSSKKCSHQITFRSLQMNLPIYLGNFGQPENENTISTDGWTKMAIFDCQFAFVVTFGSNIKF